MKLYIIVEEVGIIFWGFHNVLYVLEGIFITLVIGWRVGCLRDAVILLCFLFPLRKYAGGFHVNSRLKCLISSIFLLIVFFVIFSSDKWQIETYVILAGIFF